MASWHLTVGEHEWLVGDRPDEPGAYDFTWLTGPHPYGFSMGSSNGSQMSDVDMRRFIADFQAQINPETGYLE